MPRPLLPSATTAAANAWRAIAPVLLIILCAARALATPSTSASAGAWSNQTTQSGTTSAYTSAGPSSFGGPGSAAASAGATAGTVEGWATMSACAIEFPPDAQPCNEATGNASFTDVVSILSDAPDGTPISVQATFQVSGLLDGTGSYSYSSSFVVFSSGGQGANASSGGVVATAANQPITASSSITVGLTTGTGCPVGAFCSMGVGNPCCDGGAEESRSMTVSMSGTLVLTVPTLPPGASYVHFIGSGGHDYGIATAAVGATASRAESLSPARPNPTPNTSRLELTLARARSVDVGVFDIAGRRVATLSHGVLGPGTHALAWDGRDDRGSVAHSGMYVVRAMGEGLEATRRIVRLR